MTALRLTDVSPVNAKSIRMGVLTSGRWVVRAKNCMVSFENLSGRSVYQNSLRFDGSCSIRVRRAVAGTVIHPGNIIVLRFESALSLVTIRLEKYYGGGVRAHAPDVLHRTSEDSAHFRLTDSSSSADSQGADELTDSQIEDQDVQLLAAVVARAREESSSSPHNVVVRSTATKRSSPGLPGSGKRARKTPSRYVPDDTPPSDGRDTLMLTDYDAGTDSDYDDGTRRGSASVVAPATSPEPEPVAVEPSEPAVVESSLPAAKSNLPVAAGSNLPVAAESNMVVEPNAPAAAPITTSVDNAPRTTIFIPATATAFRPVPEQAVRAEPAELFRMPAPLPARLRSVESVPPLTRSQTIELPPLLVEELQQNTPRARNPPPRPLQAPTQPPLQAQTQTPSQAQTPLPPSQPLSAADQTEEQSEMLKTEIVIIENTLRGLYTEYKQLIETYSSKEMFERFVDVSKKIRELEAALSQDYMRLGNLAEISSNRRRLRNLLNEINQDAVRHHTISNEVLKRVTSKN